MSKKTHFQNAAGATVHWLNHHLPAPLVSGDWFFGRFLLRLSRIKHPQVMSMVRFSLISHNLGYDFVSHYCWKKRHFFLFSFRYTSCTTSVFQLHDDQHDWLFSWSGYVFSDPSLFHTLVFPEKQFDKIRSHAHLRSTAAMIQLLLVLFRSLINSSFLMCCGNVIGCCHNGTAIKP